MVIKRFSIILLCCIIAFCPLIALCDYSYAENESSDIWSNVSTKEETVAAWKAYLNSRNIASSGNPVSALVSFDYETLDNILSTIGYSMEELQSGLFFSLHNDQGILGDYLRFRYSTNAWSILNQIYSKFAIQNSLGQNENDTFDKDYKTGEWFEDDDGNGCYVYKVSTLSLYGKYDAVSSSILEFGTKYRFDGLQYFVDTSIPHQQNYELNYNNGARKINYTIYRYIANEIHCVNLRGNYYTLNQGFYSNNPPDDTYLDGHLAITKWGNRYFLCSYQLNQYKSGSVYLVLFQNYELNDYAGGVNSALNVATTGLRGAIDALNNVVSVEPKKKNSDNGYSSIDEYLEDDTSEANGSNTDIPDEDINNPSQPDNPGDNTGSFPTGGIQLPDGSFNFQMPELNINWSLDGLQNKFPLSIPWDMIRIAEALDAPAATPEFDFTVNFTRYTHRFQFDLHDFDTIMGYFRIAIEVLYTFGLIVATRQIFHIY